MLDLKTAQAWYPTTDPVHGFDHVQRVYRMAEHLALLEGADVEIVRAASLLHDAHGSLSTESARLSHQHASAEFAGEILLADGWQDERIRAVQHCIRAHRFRDDSEQPQSLEAKILFDADKLDAIGAIGVARVIAYSVQAGQSFYSPPSKRFLVSGELEPGESHTSYHEYLFKLVKLKDRLHTHSARQIAASRHRFLVRFFQELEAESDGKLVLFQDPYNFVLTPDQNIATISHMNIPYGPILVVEDFPNILELLEITLKFKGYPVVTAHNGQEALDYIQRDHPALVITDILMPKLDGFALVQKLRADPKTNQIPIIFLSATFITPEDKDFAMRLGAARFLEKPVDTEEFLLTVAEVLTMGPPKVPPPMGEREFYRGYRERLEDKLRHKNAQIDRTARLLETLPEDQKPAFQALLEEAYGHRREIQAELDELYRLLERYR